MVLNTNTRGLMLILLLLSLPILAQELLFKDGFEKCDPDNPIFCPDGVAPDVVSLISIDLVELQGRSGHEMLLPIIGDPISSSYDVIARFFGPVGTANFEFIRSDGTLISPFTLLESEDNVGSFFGLVELPSEQFLFRVSGQDSYDREYLFTTIQPYFRQTVQVRASELGLNPPGSSGKGFAYVTNHGPSGNFTVRLIDNRNVSFNILQPTITVNTGETKSVPFEFALSPDIPEFSQIEYMLSVEDESNPTIRNFSTETIPVEPVELNLAIDYSPGDCADLFQFDSVSPVSLVLYGADVVDISTLNSSTLLLNGTLPASEVAIGDFGNPNECENSTADEFPDLRLTYEASDFQLLLESDVALSNGVQILLSIIDEVSDGNLVVAYGMVEIQN